MAARIYVPLGTGMGLGDWVRVVSRFAGDGGFAGDIHQRSRTSSTHKPDVVAKPTEVVDAQWQPTPIACSGQEVLELPEDTSISDDFVTSLGQDIEVRKFELTETPKLRSCLSKLVVPEPPRTTRPQGLSSTSIHSSIAPPNHTSDYVSHPPHCHSWDPRSPRSISVASSFPHG